MRRKMNWRSFCWLFVIGSLIGYLIENVYSLMRLGVWTSRQGLVLGPFIPIYGVGAVLFSLLLGSKRKKNPLLLFFLSCLLGGGIEFFGSLLEELLLGVKLWDFKQQPFNLAGRTSLLFMFFWGILGLLYVNFLSPILLCDIQRYLVKRNGWLRLLIVFFLFNFTLSGLALNRWWERNIGKAGDSLLDQKLDQYFHDEHLDDIYPDLKVAKRSEEQ